MPPHQQFQPLKSIMLLKTKFAQFIPALAVLVLVETSWCPAAAEQLGVITLARVDTSGKDSAKIDVSKYPAGIQENYKVFSRKCSQCHSLSRPINSDYVLPNEWSHCIGRMKRRSGSDIGSSEKRKLYDFLVYDSSVRKRDKLEAKLLALTPDEQKAVENKIKQVAGKYP
jgi:hypothetical protein